MKTLRDSAIQREWLPGLREAVTQRDVGCGGGSGGWGRSVEILPQYAHRSNQMTEDIIKEV